MRIKKPKYKIGDCVVYKDRYTKDMGVYIQSQITESVGYIEESDPNDTVGWFYNTEETIRTQADNLQEDDILFTV